MFSKLQTTIKYWRWWLGASNSKGHGMHSPFVFDFIVNVLNDDREFYAFPQIENNKSITTIEKKINRLLFRMVNYYQPKNIVSITQKNSSQTEYLYAANHLISVNTIPISDDVGLKSLVEKLSNIDFIVCYDSNNTAKCFKDLIPFINNNSFFIIKNIHSNAESITNWQAIQNHSFVTATIDLYDLGIVLFNQDFKVKQHFKVRF